MPHVFVARGGKPSDRAESDSVGHRWLGVFFVAPVFLLAAPAPVVAQVADGAPRCGVEPPARPAGAVVARGGLRVASFNLLHNLTDDGEATLEARLPIAADAVVGADADVVGLQEATVTTHHGDVTRRLAALLAARTGQAWSWCRYQSDPHFPGEAEGDGGEGGPLTAAMAANFRAGEPDWREMAAVVSRYPIVRSGARRLPTRAYEAPACVPPDPDCSLDAATNSRVVLWARVQAPGGAVDVFDTHLSHELTAVSDETKLLQARVAVAYVAEKATADPTPDFLLGDLNSAEDSAVHDAIAGAGFVDTYRRVNPADAGPTADQDLHAPARTTTVRIDYVWARPGSCGLVVPASTRFPDRPAVTAAGPLWPSDHLGVVSALGCAGAPHADASVAPSSAAGGRGSSSLPATGDGGSWRWVGLGLVGAGVLAQQARWRRMTSDRLGSGSLPRSGRASSS